MQNWGSPSTQQVRHRPHRSGGLVKAATIKHRQIVVDTQRRIDKVGAIFRQRSGDGCAIGYNARSAPARCRRGLATVLQLLTSAVPKRVFHA